MSSAHILIVEDSRTQGEALRGDLVAAGHDVTVARDGSEALDVLRSVTAVELVISDVVMPQMDGYELCRRIKADRSTERLPVILLTSLRDPVDIVRGLEAGADNFLTKPYDPARLLSRVENVLESRRENDDAGRFRMGAEVRLLGHRFTVDVDRQQILDLLMGSFEDLVYANARLRDQEEQLVRAREQAVAANEAKSRFVAQLAHELRNPLGVVSAYSELLKDQELTEQQHRAVDAMGKSAHRMFQLISDLSDIESIESGQLELASEEVRLRLVLDEALEQTRELARRHEVDVMVEGDVDAVAVADERRLCQVVANLLSNGIKYNRPGGQVRVACQSGTGDRVRIAVSDTGHGIAPDELPRLFVPFDRLGADRNIEGTGIGLPLVRDLVDAMGGTLDVESQPDVGSTFTVELHGAPPSGAGSS